MKRCSKCGLNYKDETLEFCLEDGTRLVSATAFDTEIPTITHSNNLNITTERTVAFPASGKNSKSDLNDKTEPSTSLRSAPVKEKAFEKGNIVLEKAPVVIALAHNWWQWIYLNNQTYSSFTAYIFSTSFLIWLALLILGITLGLLSFKRIKNNGFALTGLIILAINFILILVPKR